MNGLKRLGVSRRAQSNDSEGSVGFDEIKEEGSTGAGHGGTGSSNSLTRAGGSSGSGVDDESKHGGGMEDEEAEDDDADDVDLMEWEVSRAGKRPNDGR